MKPLLLILLLIAVGLVLAALLATRKRPGSASNLQAGTAAVSSETAAPATPPRDKPADLDTWLREAVAFYRELGFMPEHADKTADEVFEIVKARLMRDWGDSLPNADTASLELFFIESLPSRVWWGDTEADVFVDNHVYEEVLAEWSRISLGAFEPEDVAELWETDTGPLTISFMLDGQPRELHPEVRDDWLDMNIVTGINRMIEPTGRQFVVHIPDQTAVLMCVTPEERQRLETERGWTFID